MATNFPSSLDNSTTIPVEGATTNLATNHVTAHQNLQDAVEAIEAKIGADSSAVTTSHDYKLGEILTTDKAVGKSATQTLTNKTLTSPTVTGATITTSTVNGVTLTTGGSATDFLAGNGTYVAGSVTNASTTAKGIVELATSAEITAGTATGGTGAALVVTPDSLASSTPVFSASSLTSVQKLNITTATTDVGTFSTAENTLFSYSLAGGKLSTNNAVRTTGYITLLESTSTLTTTLRFKYGATTIFAPTFVITAGVPSSYTHKFDFIILASGATGTQNADLLMNGLGTTTNIQIQTGTSSEDSTAAKNIIVTAQSSVSSGNYHATIRNVCVEYIR